MRYDITPPVLLAETSDATPKVATYNAESPNNTNQIVLEDNTTLVIEYTALITKQGVSTKTLANTKVIYGKVIACRGVGAASIVVYNTAQAQTFDNSSAWSCLPSADTINGAVAFTVVGAAATNLATKITFTLNRLIY